MKCNALTREHMLCARTARRGFITCGTHANQENALRAQRHKARTMRADRRLAILRSFTIEELKKELQARLDK